MISIIRSGLAGVSQEIAVISNNIANANSVGFKKSMASFDDVYSEQSGIRPGVSSGLGISLTDPRSGNLARQSGDHCQDGRRNHHGDYPPRVANYRLPIPS